MKQKITISIGIPAYNEEENIASLLGSILKQDIRSGILEQILVVSDSSIDGTVKKVKNIDDKRISVIENKKREGKNASQNTIIKKTTSDVLILFDADIMLSTDLFIEKLIQPIIKDETIGLVGANVVSLRPKKFFESVISLSHSFKHSLYAEISDDNIYLCHGRARAFSKRFYKYIMWPNDVPEDAYSYLLCKEKNFRFAFAKDAKVFFRSPTNLSDHAKQSNRFKAGKSALLSYFSNDIILKKYAISRTFLVKKFIAYFSKHPLEMSSYIFLLCYLRFFQRNNFYEQSKWEISKSSKKFSYIYEKE